MTDYDTIFTAALLALGPPALDSARGLTPNHVTEFYDFLRAAGITTILPDTSYAAWMSWHNRRD